MNQKYRMVSVSGEIPSNARGAAALCSEMLRRFRAGNNTSVTLHNLYGVTGVLGVLQHFLRLPFLQEGDTMLRGARVRAPKRTPPPEDKLDGDRL